MRRFGSDVTVIDRNDRLAHHEDDDVTQGLHALFKDEGIEVVLNARIKGISGKSSFLASLVLMVKLLKINLIFQAGDIFEYARPAG